jgi:hypothetical protein
MRRVKTAGSIATLTISEYKMTSNDTPRHDAVWDQMGSVKLWDNMR